MKRIIITLGAVAIAATLAPGASGVQRQRRAQVEVCDLTMFPYWAPAGIFWASSGIRCYGDAPPGLTVVTSVCGEQYLHNIPDPRWVMLACRGPWRGINGVDHIQAATASVGGSRTG